MCYNYISYIVSVWSFIRSQLLDEIQDVHLHLDVFRIVGDKEKRDTSFLWKEMTEQVQVNRLDVMANLVWGESQDPCWASENLACVVGNLSRCGEVFMGTILNWWQMGDWGPVGRYFELVADGRLRASGALFWTGGKWETEGQWQNYGAGEWWKTNPSLPPAPYFCCWVGLYGSWGTYLQRFLLVRHQLI